MKILPSCQEVHRRVIHAQDVRLPLSERITLRVHLALCKNCVNFANQMRLIRRALQRLGR